LSHLPPSPQNRRRSERVMLQVPIIVAADSPEGAEVQEETHTLVVNAHGGLVKLDLEVVPGQPILLINPATKAELSARVIRVDNPPGGHAAVAFEFDEPSPQFWPIVFPPEDWGVRKP
jgi:hypothetical protein